MAPTPTSEEETLRGIIVPSAWGLSGEALRVAILTREEGEYEVAHRLAGRQLLHLLREEVEARVVVHPGEELPKVVTVLSYTVLQPEDRSPDVLDGPPRRGRGTPVPSSSCGHGGG